MWAKVLGAIIEIGPVTTVITGIEIEPCTPLFVGSGITIHAHMGTDVESYMSVGFVRNRVRWEKIIRPLPKPMGTLRLGRGRIMGFSGSSASRLSYGGWGVRWSTADFINAHKAVRESGKFNFESCRIPIPTIIRYDRIEEALDGEISPRVRRVLDLLKYGMPIDCDPRFGVCKRQKNHFSAVSHREAVGEYLADSMKSQAILGPFKASPIKDLCFSPIMTVPFPPGKAVNDGISRSTYLEFEVKFSLPSVQSMVDRINHLGPGCLLYKRDLKGAFRQFCTDPGDYGFSGLWWDGNIYIDTRLAMGLRSAAYCCQSVTELIAKIAGRQAHVLVYLDDFGGAEKADKAVAAFNHLGSVLEYCGLLEAPEKAVPPSTKMDWLGIRFDTAEWTMSLKPGKLDELLLLLPKLLNFKRVSKVLLQKLLGNLVWAAAVVRSGVIYFNRLLALLRKLKRPNHSIYFSIEAKKDVLWWMRALQLYGGKAAIPPAVWTPLISFATDASLEGFGMVWGTRALAGLFPIEFEEMDINKKEMITVMAAIKHWFCDLCNMKIKIYVDNQVCVALLNYGITKSPFLAACLREIHFVLAMYNIEMKAEYISSKDNFQADLCSRAFSNDVFFK